MANNAAAESKAEVEAFMASMARLVKDQTLSTIPPPCSHPTSLQAVFSGKREREREILLLTSTQSIPIRDVLGFEDRMQGQGFQSPSRRRLLPVQAARRDGERRLEGLPAPTSGTRTRADSI